ncbi:ankyrin repeat-containing domain protein [Phaeosphaeriaceae sp. PMI808]|nr:ankyrin repeat-containing domain protein [Phaeosphaeriaceae sp. PMI808]
MAAALAKIQYGRFKDTALSFGFDIVYPNLDESTSLKEPIKYEIVAIPGLGADDEWSWKLGRVNWLTNTNMLQEKIPDARISHFSYTKQWLGKGSVDQRLDNIASRLVQGLDHIRRNSKTKTPIIFVCHSLGGIILAKALLMAQSNQDEYPYVYPWVAGSIFLGTPFHGISEPRAQVLATMAASIGMDSATGLVKFLERDSEMLRILLDKFGILVRDAQIRLFCFYEQQESDYVKKVVVKGLAYKRQEHIVDEISASITSASKTGLDTDHFGLNKFSGSKDRNYASVSQQIRITTEAADRLIKSRQKAVRNALVDDAIRCSMCNQLAKGFQDIDAAMHGQYKVPQGGKLSSVLELPAYTDWKQLDRNKLLWVHGEAGTGQDAIASSAVLSLKASSLGHDSIVTSFYCDQSDKMRRSLSGLLQMVVRQIIEQNQDLAEHLLSDSKKNKEPGKQEFDPESITKVHVLWDALQTMANHLPSGSIYVVVYAFEQLADDSLETFLGYMRELSNALTEPDEDLDATPIKWMLVSRTGRPDIKKSLHPGALEIDLEDKDSQELVSNDFKIHISISVDQLELPSSLAYFVKRHIHSRAEDNRIYVGLVIQELKNVWTPGVTQFAEIRKLLESFPYGLTNMFDHVRKRILNPQAEGLEYTKEILRCLICAHVAPTLRELAIIASLPKEDHQNLEMLKTYLVRCGAFLTLSWPEWDLGTATVEWIDRSAQDYLEQYAKDDLALDLLGMQHGIIALRSLEYIYEVFNEQADSEQQPADEDAEAQEDGADGETEEGNAETNEDQENDREDENDDDEDDEDDEDNEEEATNKDDESNGEALSGEVVKYPIRYWVEHAKLAPTDVLDEIDLYHPFWQEDSSLRQSWWQAISDVHTWHDQAGVLALHVAVILEFPALVKHLIGHDRMDEIHRVDSLGFQPLYYACESGNRGIMDELLQNGAEINHNDESSQPTALLAASSNGHKEIVQILLDGNANLDSCSDDYGTPLYAAVENQHQEIVELLLKNGADVNMVSGPASRALNIGASVGNLEGVRTLVEHGAEVDPEEYYWYSSALGVASRNGHEDVVEYLLAHGWNPNREMKTYGSFLTAAATYNHLGVVEMLLKSEDRVLAMQMALEIASKKGFVPVVKAILEKKPTLRLLKAFSLAAYYGRTEVLEYLFEMDHNREIQGDSRAMSDALYQATDNEREEAITLLLEHGADPNAEGPTYGFALAASAYDGTTDIMKALIEKGADVNKRGGDYGTALQAAAYHGDAKNVKLLIDHGAKLNTEPIGLYGNELQAAVFNGNEETIRLLLDHRADVNARGGTYTYPIITAVSRGYHVVVRILLEHNADVNVRGHDNNWPVISLAGTTLIKEDLQLILKYRADINARCDKGTTALINCAAAGDEEGVKFLLKNGADVHIDSEILGPALHAAAKLGDEGCCQILLDAGADVNAIGGEYGTAIQAASWAEDIETVQVLLNAGADVTSEAAISGLYGTALQAASAEDSIKVVRALLKAGAAVNVEPANGIFGCALSAAVAEGNDKIVKLLLKHGADVNFEGGKHQYPIMAAAQCDYSSEVVQLLLDHGANPSAKGGVWGSAIIAAAYINDKDNIELLVEHGADVLATGGKYGSALQAASIKGDMEVVEYILDHGIGLVNYRGGKYETALIAAAYFGHIEVVNKLLDSGAEFRIQGGKYHNAITAAALRGNKAVLDRLLELKPPESLLDEALVEACAHRQSSSVAALLESGADISTRHPILGLPSDALDAPAAVDENSDNEDNDAVDGQDSEDDSDDDNEDDDDDNKVWEGDNDSVAGDTEDGRSVADLQLDDEVTEEANIRKLLKSGVARCQRNPTIKRFRTVKHRKPDGLGAGPPPLPNTQPPPSTNYEAGNTSNRIETDGLQYAQHSQESWSQPFASGPSYQQPANPYLQQHHPPYATPPPQTETQFSNTSQNNGVLRQSNAINRKPLLNPGPTGRYQQHQPSYPSPQGSIDQSTSRQDFAGSPHHTPPPINPYGQSNTQQQYPPPLPQRQSQQFNQAQQPPYQAPPPTQYQAYPSPPPQPSGYTPYSQGSYDQGSQRLSQSSFQSSQYASSTPYGSQTWGTPMSSQSSFSPPPSQGNAPQSSDEAQARRWQTGRYDGDGYGYNR